MKLEDYPTPLTDAETKEWHHSFQCMEKSEFGDWVLADHARDLERKLRKCRAVMGGFALHFDRQGDTERYEKAMTTLDETT